MIAMRLSEAAQLVAGEFSGHDGEFLGVSTDTRTLTPQQLFFALRGPHFDAHDKLAAAVAAGAAGAVVEHPSTLSLSQIRTTDVRQALGHLARSWRQRFALPVLAITGSAGKTTVKEMLAAILRQRGPVLATRGNLNNDIGLPLTLFALAATHRYAVLEMGANQPGDIAWLCDISRPHVGLITLCAPAHLAGFGSLESVARAKGEIIGALAADGVAVINNEDAFAPWWRELAAERRIISFGAGGRISASEVHVRDGRTCFTLGTDIGAIDISIAHRGLHNVRNALAAAAAARALDATLADIQAGLEQSLAVAGRLQYRDGMGGSRLLDDSYNANPASLAAALAVLACERGRKWLVLGDMAELGDSAEKYHVEAGGAAADAGVERLFTIGELARHAAANFSGPALHFSDHDGLIDVLRAALSPAVAADTTILIKGSRVMALDLVANALAARSQPQC